MLILSTGLLITATMLLVIGLVGRGTPAGVYCKRCRFDLGGVDVQSDGARCPECGAATNNPGARAERVRYRRPAPLWAGLIIFVLSGAILLTAMLGGAGALYARVPTNSLIKLLEWGDDEALDETLRRIALPNAAFSQPQWDRLIAQGLEIQADASIDWDWRWGELLSIALTENRLDPEQIKQYFVNGLAPELTVRTTAHPGQSGIENRLDATQNRMWAINYKPTVYSVTCQLVAFGEVGKEPIQQSKVYEFPRAFNIAATPDQGTGASYGGGRGISHRIDRQPGESARVYFDYVIRVRHLQSDEIVVDKTVREEFDIEFVDPDQPLVELVRDEAKANQILDAVRAAPMRVSTAFPEPNTYGMVTVMSGAVHIACVDAPVAFTLSIEIDGEMIDIGSLQNFQSPHTGGFLGQVWLRSSTRDEQGLERLRELHAKLLGMDSVRLFARADPVLAATRPETERIIDLDFVFDDVKIIVQDQIPQWMSEVDMADFSSTPRRLDHGAPQSEKEQP